MRNKWYVFIYVILIFFLTGCSSNTITAHQPTVQPLQETDFKYVYNNITLTIGMNYKEVNNKLGTGSEKKYVGKEPNKDNLRYYSQGFPNENPEIEIVTRVNTSTQEEVIANLALINGTTNRGLRVGNTLKDLINKYGEGEVYLETLRRYKKDNQLIVFEVKDDKITRIYMHTESSKN